MQRETRRKTVIQQLQIAGFFKKINYIQLKTVVCHLVYHCVKVLYSTWYLAFIET